MLLGKQLSPNHQSITLWASRPVCLEEHLNFDEDDHSKENYEGGDHKDSLATENIPWRHKAVWWYRQISPKKHFFQTLDVWIWNGGMFGFCLQRFKCSTHLHYDDLPDPKLKLPNTSTRSNQLVFNWNINNGCHWCFIQQTVLQQQQSKDM